MNRIAVANELLKVAKTLVSDHRKEWEEILDLRKTKKHHGNEQMVTFMAEVWNGGVQQWVDNGNADDLNVVVGVARSLGPKGKELARRLQSLRSTIQEYEDSSNRPSAKYEDDEEMTLTEEKMNLLDDFFYQNDDAIVDEFLAYLKS